MNWLPLAMRLSNARTSIGIFESHGHAGQAALAREAYAAALEEMLAMARQELRAMAEAAVAAVPEQVADHGGWKGVGV